MPTTAKTYAVLYLIAAAFAFIVIHVFLQTEQPLYPYDFGDYFRMSIDFSRKMQSGFFYWFNSVKWCVARQDYNPSSIAPLSPIHLLFGDSRFVYIYSLACLYLIPTVAIGVRMSAAAFAAPVAAPSKREHLVLFACLMLFWPLWTPLIRGYSDIAGLIPCGLALLIVTRTRFLTKASVWHGIQLGALLWLSFMLRRWYALIVVAFELATAGFMLLTLWRSENQRTVAALKSAALAYLANGVTLCALLFALQRPLVESILAQSYSQQYAMYKLPLEATLLSFYDLLGLIIIALVGLGTILAIRDKNDTILFAIAVFLLSFVIFYRIQTPDIHHTMGIVFWLIPALAYAMVRTARAAGRGAALVWTLVAIVFLASFSGIFFPAIGRSLPSIAHVFPTQRFYPLRNDNYLQSERLIAAIKALATPDRQAAVFAEHVDLNASLLLSIDPSLTPLLTNPDTSLVDLRDGFDFDRLDARYAIVARPAMVDHPLYQRVVSLPNDMILSGACIGDAYARTGTAFEISGHEVFIYERTKPVSDAGRSCLVAKLREYYPSWVQSSSVFGPAKGAK